MRILHVEDEPLDTKVVEGDPLRLRQVFQNLIDNAVKHADKPAVKICVGCADAGSFWEFLVADNGPGISVHDLTYPQDRPRSDELNAQLHEGRLPMFEYEKRYLKRDGLPLWVQVAVSAVRDNTGRYLYSVGTVVDISARKAAEAQVHLQAAALEAAPNAISLSKTDPKGTIVWVNQAFTRLTGYNEEAAIGQSHHILNSGRQDEAFYHQLWPNGWAARSEWNPNLIVAAVSGWN